jgi:hypothetical protein
MPSNWARTWRERKGHLFRQGVVVKFSSAHGHTSRFLNILSALLLTFPILAQPQAPPSPVRAAATAPSELPGLSAPRQKSREHWRKAMAQTLPQKKGCFTASYPDTSWEEVQCLPAPVPPYSRPAHGGRLETVGNGNDFVATVTSGTLSAAEGAFPLISNVTSESDGGANVFSLQLNSQTFTTTACNGVSGCLGWEQFVYSSHVYSGAFIQNWLLNYGSTCPAGGWQLQAGTTNCYVNSSVVSVPSQTAENLTQLVLMGTANSGGTDAVLMYVDDTLYSASEGDSTVNLAANWKTAEFNVFGDGGGSEATFNSGATLTVRTTVNNGTANSPSCGTSGTTGETNSLTLVHPCCPFGGASPGIVFKESSASGATAICPVLENTWMPPVLTFVLGP